MVKKVQVAGNNTQLNEPTAEYTHSTGCAGCAGNQYEQQNSLV